MDLFDKIDQFEKLANDTLDQTIKKKAHLDDILLRRIDIAREHAKAMFSFVAKPDAAARLAKNPEAQRLIQMVFQRLMMELDGIEADVKNAMRTTQPKPISLPPTDKTELL